ncbi:uncharacterized protein QC764_0107030 [Podospora pseudoanserina]|uniref:Uncharacterized protein n=1 Tax=Podospora pseudoanserina TaxID=2609844 RepID=A0ABR0HM88_9PEZI|nr:hypothetical protein QC764_0107030 [Podospora pseudoanserina]
MRFPCGLLAAYEHLRCFPRHGRLPFTYPKPLLLPYLSIHCGCLSKEGHWDLPSLVHTESVVLVPMITL